MVVEELPGVDEVLPENSCVAAEEAEGVEDASDDEVVPAPNALPEEALLEVSWTAGLALLREPCALQVPAEATITMRRTTATAMATATKRFVARFSEEPLGGTAVSVATVFPGTSDTISILIDCLSALVLGLVPIEPAKGFDSGSSDFAFSNSTVASVGPSSGSTCLTVDLPVVLERLFDSDFGAPSIKNVVLQWRQNASSRSALTDSGASQFGHFISISFMCPSFLKRRLHLSLLIVELYLLLISPNREDDGHIMPLNKITTNCG